MKLNAEQQEAVEYLEGPLLVLAGPGTGKTTVLSSRVAQILKVTDTAPENILCLTFTEKAAENMRERMLGLIGIEADKVSVSTYHAFGSTVLAKYKDYEPVAEREFGEPIDNVTQFKIVKKIQESLPARDILRKAQIRDLIDTIKEAKGAELTPENLEQIATENLAQTAEINARLAPIFANFQKRLRFGAAVERFYRPMQETLAEFASPRKIVKNIEPEANFLLRGLTETIKNESAKANPSTTPLTNWLQHNFCLNDDGKWQLNDRMANLKLQAFARVMRKYHDALAEADLFDFADMIMEAIKILKTKPGFCSTLSEQFQYILLDEFQDTNPAQFELIKLLTNYEQPQVMAVGDDDQAIFEFQGANASNLLEFQEHYGAKVIVLSKNHRSTAEILGLSRHIGTQITDSFEKRSRIIDPAGRERKITKTLSACAPWKAELGGISRHEFVSADAENSWVASKVRKLLDAGAEPKEIAIITPRHKYFAPLLPYLKAKNIAIAYEKRENVLEDQRIHELTVLARFCHELAEGGNPAHWLLELLSFDFWEVSPLATVQTVSANRHAPALEILTKSANPQLIVIAEFLAALTLQAYDAPLELWLDQAIGSALVSKQNSGEPVRSPFLHFYAQNAEDYSTFSLYENLNSLRSAILQHLKKPKPKLADLIEFLDDYELADEGILNTSPYQDVANSVQVLTVHKAKGLEFQHVFLLAVDSLEWGRGKGNNNRLVLPKNLLQIRHTGSTDDERLRLFFVALTRAKRTLTLTNSRNDFSGKTPRRLEYLAETEAVDKQGNQFVLSPYLPAESQIVHEHTADLEEARRQSDLQTTWRAFYEQPQPELLEFLRERMKNYRVTATDLTTFVDLIYAGPAEFYRRKVLGAPSEPLSASLALGNLIHATFERVTNRKITDTEALEFFQGELEKQPLLLADHKYVAERGEHALKISLEHFREILRDENAKGEINLALERPSLKSGVPLSGKVDHITINPATHELEIYDFKTGQFHPEAWDEHPTLFKYKLQLGVYKLLLNSSRTYAHCKIKRGHILFVDPNDDDQVYDKVYEFSREDEQELVRLIERFYRHATTLDFVRDPELMLEPDRGRKIKRILEFVKRIIEKQE